MRMVINEMPYTSEQVGMLARKDGKYVRPILSRFLDIRIEDFIDRDTMLSSIQTNYLGRLPDVPEIGQINKYMAATPNLVVRVDLSQEEAQQLMQQGQHLYLPNRWWEYAMCLDANGKYIKAPLRFRNGEPSPEEIDERLDEFPENVGKIDVISPQILSTGLKEDYLNKLKRI